LKKTERERKYKKLLLEKKLERNEKEFLE